MRLWHYMLLPYLPKGQLLSQKRECDLIWKDLANGRKTNHILINYIWEYEDYLKELTVYYKLLEKEFIKRGCKFRSSIPITDVDESYIPFAKHQTKRYLVQCFWNLAEKHDRGQKDFDNELYKKLEKFMEERK